MSGIEHEVVEVTHAASCAACDRAVANAVKMLATGTVEATAHGWSPLFGTDHKATVRRRRTAEEQIADRIESELAGPIDQAALDVVERLKTDRQTVVEFSPGDATRYRCYIELAELTWFMDGEPFPKPVALAVPFDDDGDAPKLVVPGRLHSAASCERFTGNLHGQYVWAAFFNAVGRAIQ